MSLIIAGSPLSVSYREDVIPSRLSVRFAKSSRRLSRLASDTLQPLSVTVSTTAGSFTTVIDFVPDPLCGDDVVLGKDWSDSCRSSGVDIPNNLLDTYSGDVSPMTLPEKFSLSSGSDSQCVTIDDNVSSDNMHNVKHNRDSLTPSKIVLPEPASSTPLRMSHSVADGLTHLQMLLLHRYETGIHASPFQDTVRNSAHTLQHLLSMHGICSQGFSTEDCRVVLLRHLFSGHCVIEQCASADRTACLLFSKGFKSAEEMSTVAFTIMSDATSRQRSTEDLLNLLKVLNIDVDFTPQKVRRQINRELKRQATQFLTTRRLVECSHSIFVAFERHSHASLLGLASAHGIRINRFTDTVEQLKQAIVSHFAAASCFKARLLNPNDSCSTHDSCEGCRNTTTTIDETQDITSQTQFLLSWLTHQPKKWTRLPLKRLLTALEIDFKTDDDIGDLRRQLRQYVTDLKRKVAAEKKNDQSETECAHIREKLSKIQSEWPSLIPQSLKDQLINTFRQQTSKETLKTATCASCAELILQSRSTKVNIDDINVNVFMRPDRRLTNDGEKVVDSTWLHPDVTPPSLPSLFPCLENLILDRAGVEFNNEKSTLHLILCKLCARSVKSGHVPPLALANHMFLGDVPSELKDLTVVEETMIAKCRAKCWIVQLKEEISDAAFSANVQRGIKGHIIVYPQRPSAVASVLPPSIEEISTPICVIFVGSIPPSEDWLRTKAKPLAVRREKVRAALIWLKEHNPLYKDIVINHNVLDGLPANYTLPVHVEHVLPNLERESLTSRFDTSQVPSTNQCENISFENVVITDVDGSAPVNELRAAALRHIKKKGGGFVEIGHDPIPINEFFNPDMFPMIYPTLFPYGLGGFEDQNRSVPVSLKRQTKHVFNLSDKRFQEHYSFLFTVFNVLQRREILLHTSLKVKKKRFPAVAKTFASVSEEAIHIVSERIARGDSKTANTPEERQVLNLMKEVNVVTSHVPGSSAARVEMRNEIRALMMEKGLPSFYITINPADVYNPLVKFLAGADIDIDKLLPEQVPDYWEQSLLVAKNPAIAAKFFDLYMQTFIHALLGYNGNLNSGILGVVKAYYGCVEAQGRGTLHCHMLVWVEGGLNPNEIRQRILADGDLAFRDRLLAFLDDTISNSIPPLPNNKSANECSLSSTRPHPCSTRGVSIESHDNDEGNTLTRQEDLHYLVKQCQSHTHSQTCYKYWKGPLSGEARECRFDLDEKNTCPVSSIDIDTGELTLRHLNGMVNNFNSTIIEAIRCNMDLKFIGSGASAKAILYYITDYITKSQLKSHVAFAALELAVKKLGEYNPQEDELTFRAKRLLQRCAYTMISHQELSAQQVCSYLMDFGDHYTSHKFRHLYWTAFERVVDSEDTLMTNFSNENPECSAENKNTEAENGNYDKEMEDGDFASETSYSNDVDEVTVPIKSGGEMIAKTSQVWDYQQRPSSLDDMCLWDMTAQTDRVKNKRQTSDTEEDSDRDTEDDNEDIPASLYNDFDDLTKILSSSSRRRPLFAFESDHPDKETHSLKIRKSNDRLVPVPIGPAIPRRDRPDVKERYSKIMLIMFKPWRLASDLHASNESWSAAFQAFVTNCSCEKKKIMDNMQILHECKDSRDDHFTERRSRNRDRQKYVSVDLTERMETEDDDLADDNECNDAVLDHLLSMEDCHSTSSIKARQDVLSCITHAEESGLFTAMATTAAANPDNEGLQEVQTELIPLENIWKAEYETRRLQWKQKACKTTVTEGALRDERDHLSNNAWSQIREYPTEQEINEPRIHGPQQPTDPEPNVDLDQVIEQFTLNREQARAFRIVAEHSLQNKPSPLRMFLGGPGGTGKSRVINALKEFFERRNQARRFRLSSYTGVAAKNISGMTLHAALCLNQRNNKGSSGKTRRDLIAMWEGVDYLFIDEVSMIGCRLLLKISEALNDAKQSQIPFGGINVVFAGDFAQLPPVGDAKLFTRMNTHDIKTRQGNQNIFGKLLWLSVKTVVILKEIMRQQGRNNEEFVNLLSRLRDGQCNLDDYSALDSRRLNSHDDGDWSNVPIIVSNNDCKDALNTKATIDFAAKTGRPLHWYYAEDTRGGKKITDERINQQLENMHSGRTNQRMKKTPLVIGMPVMICQNFDVEHGVVNGCTGTLKQIRFRTDSSGRRHALSCIVEAPTTSGSPLPNLQQQHIAVLQDTIDLRFTHPFSHKTCSIKRTQVPVMPAFALTAHKAQGQTMDRVVVDLESCRGTESAYVMLSRVKSLDGLRILRPFKISRIQCRPSEDRRREIRRLDFLRLITVMESGTPLESSLARKALSTTKYKDYQYMPDNPDSHSTDSVHRLERLQKTFDHLTSKPCPDLSLPQPPQNLPIIASSSLNPPQTEMTTSEVSQYPNHIRDSNTSTESLHNTNVPLHVGYDKSVDVGSKSTTLQYQPLTNLKRKKSTDAGHSFSTDTPTKKRKRTI